eukprot:s4311_g2.t3
MPRVEKEVQQAWLAVFRVLLPGPGNFVQVTAEIERSAESFEKAALLDSSRRMTGALKRLKKKYPKLFTASRLP